MLSDGWMVGFPGLSYPSRYTVDVTCIHVYTESLTVSENPSDLITGEKVDKWCALLHLWVHD